MNFLLPSDFNSLERKYLLKKSAKGAIITTFYSLHSKNADDTTFFRKKNSVVDNIIGTVQATDCKMHYRFKTNNWHFDPNKIQQLNVDIKIILNNDQ